MFIEIYNTPLRPPYGNICTTSPPHLVKVALMQALQIYTRYCMVDFRLVCYKRKQKLLSELLSSICNKCRIKISPFPSNVVKVSSLILISVLAGHEVHNDWTRHCWTGDTQQRCWHQRMQILAQACGHWLWRGEAGRKLRMTGATCSVCGPENSNNH